MKTKAARTEPTSGEILWNEAGGRHRNWCLVVNGSAIAMLHRGPKGYGVIASDANDISATDEQLITAARTSASFWGESMGYDMRTVEFSVVRDEYVNSAGRRVSRA